jgi:hypothetical protein
MIKYHLDLERVYLVVWCWFYLVALLIKRRMEHFYLTAKPIVRQLTSATNSTLLSGVVMESHLKLVLPCCLVIGRRQ